MTSPCVKYLMSKFFLIALASILCGARATADFGINVVKSLIHGDVVDLGYQNTTNKIGVLTDKYETLSPLDILATKNFFRIVGKITPPDPYSLEYLPDLPISVLDPIMSGTTKLRNLQMFGSNQIKLEDIELRLQDPKNYRCDVNVTIPKLYITAKFYVNLKIGFILPFKFSGLLRMWLEDIKVSGALGAELVNLRTNSSENHFQINAIDFVLHMNSLKVQMSVSDNIIIKLIENNPLITQAVYALIKQDISDEIGGVIIDVINDSLTLFSFDDILKVILNIKQ